MSSSSIGLWNMFSKLFQTLLVQDRDANTLTSSFLLDCMEEEAVVEETVYPYSKGRVHFHGTSWMGRCDDDVKLIAGQRVHVTGLRNTTLLIQPIASSLSKR